MTVRHCTLALAVAGALVAVVLEGCEDALSQACHVKTNLEIKNLIEDAKKTLEDKLEEACKNVAGDVNATLNGNSIGCAAIKKKAEDNFTKVAEKDKEDLHKQCMEWLQNSTGNIKDAADDYIKNHTDSLSNLKDIVDAAKKEAKEAANNAKNKVVETANNAKDKANDVVGKKVNEAVTEVEIDSSGGGPIFRKGGTEGAVSVVAGVGLASLAAVGALVLALKRLGRERHGMALLPDQSQSEEDGFEVAVQEAK